MFASQASSADAPQSGGAQTRKVGFERLRLGGPSFVAVISGELLVREDGDGADSERAVGGDVVTVFPGDRVTLCARPTSAEVLLLSLEPEKAESAIELAGCEVLPRRRAFTIERTKSRAARRARHLLQELATPPLGGDGGDRIRRLAHALELLSLGLEEQDEPSPRGPARSGQRRRRAFVAAVSELEGQSLDGLSLARFAGELGLSERQVSRLFREEYGRSFREHVMRLRLARAKALLRETDRAIIEVAGQTGWRSLAHFNAVFRREVGTTPSSFRERERAGPDA